jgi:hypothetical protein
VPGIDYPRTFQEFDARFPNEEACDELQRRNYANNTADANIRALRDFAAYYNLPPDQLVPEQIGSGSAYGCLGAFGFAAPALQLADRDRWIANNDERTCTELCA